eukprot:TRINITY_DN2096_c0_g1_i24.p1 TRINITY_DN2096_c0_g1~~TRINITY_DN2096_c0_g1_i24.p1  ORF type:complete len:105 (+),score=23.94 TRINITY_DN2096_c0_g1_i24:435-749(+)
MEELEKANLQHFNEFNKAWDQAIQELEENLRKIEQDLVETHFKELQIFDEEVEKIEIPKVKYSKEVLNLRVIFQKMLKAKQLFCYLRKNVTIIDLERQTILKIR